jgi:PncC family amidohydrolase
MLTNVPGISEVLLEGVVCYSDSSKVRRLGVPQDVILRHGAVSEAVAAAMARGAAKAAQAKVGLSITGIAGPGGGTTQKPVGLVYAGVHIAGKVTVWRFFFEGKRDTIKQLAAVGALRMLRARLKTCSSQIQRHAHTTAEKMAGS